MTHNNILHNSSPFFSRLYLKIFSCYITTFKGVDLTAMERKTTLKTNIEPHLPALLLTVHLRIPVHFISQQSRIRDHIFNQIWTLKKCFDTRWNEKTSGKCYIKPDGPSPISILFYLFYLSWLSSTTRPLKRWRKQCGRQWHNHYLVRGRGGSKILHEWFAPT